MRNIFEWIGMKEEKEVLEHSREHFDKVLQTVKELEKAVNAYVSGDTVNMRDRIHNVAKLEHEADIIRRKLMMDVTKGVILPEDRGDLMNFVTRVDAIADWSHTAGRFLALWEGVLPENFGKELEIFVETTVGAVEKLKNVVEAVGKESEQKILELCTAVESAEETADDQHRDILKIILKSNLSVSQVIVAHDLIEAIENISDAAEIVADSLRILAVEISGR
ncbi:MAG: TIGR00153 family protein [Elusimicrobia bacterium]|nr:TIGR00153 family protein [Elusimicrobiota bacterium]